MTVIGDITVWPIGSSLGHWRRASASLTMTTPGASRGVVRGEEAALDQRHAERAEVVVVDRLVLRLRLVAGSRTRAPLDEERSAPRRFEREEVAGAGHRHARLRAHRRQQPIVEVDDLGEVAVRVRQFDFGGHRARQP